MKSQYFSTKDNLMVSTAHFADYSTFCFVCGHYTMEGSKDQLILKEVGQVLISENNTFNPASASFHFPGEGYFVTKQ